MPQANTKQRGKIPPFYPVSIQEKSKAHTLAYHGGRVGGLVGGGGGMGG